MVMWQRGDVVHTWQVLVVVDVGGIGVDVVIGIGSGVGIDVVIGSGIGIDVIVGVGGSIVIGAGGVIDVVVVGIGGIIVISLLPSMLVSLLCIMVEASTNDPPCEQWLMRLDVGVVLFVVVSWCL